MTFAPTQFTVEQLFASDRELKSSSKSNCVLSTAGDTIRICEKRTPTDDSGGLQGELCYDDDFFYICVSDNKWRRVQYN